MRTQRDASTREQTIHFIMDGEPISGVLGDTIASALYAQGRRTWHLSRSGEERGIFCGIGVCFDCLVTVNGVPGVRACIERISEGMEVKTNLPVKRNHGSQS